MCIEIDTACVTNATQAGGRARDPQSMIKTKRIPIRKSSGPKAVPVRFS
jgi:hypothetical protein